MFRLANFGCMKIGLPTKILGQPSTNFCELGNGNLKNHEEVELRQIRILSYQNVEYYKYRQSKKSYNYSMLK